MLVIKQKDAASQGSASKVSFACFDEECESCWRTFFSPYVEIVEIPELLEKLEAMAI